MKRQLRALAVHDISCVGKCSLTVALPIISAAGIETSVLPTAVLSTHTGGFTGYTFRDLTEDIMPIASHWEELGIEFDAVYTGYLGSFKQLELVKGLFAQFGKKGLVLVDPVMADHGKLYPGFDKSFPGGMAELCKMADVIVPNLTEAALLLGEEYVEAPHSEAYIEGLLKRLGAAFGGKIVLTGVSFDGKTLGAACYDSAGGDLGYAMANMIEGSYHGTGDVFGSALLAGLLRGLSLIEAARCAVNFTVDSIKLTEKDKESRYGVRFESALPGFIKSLGL